MLWKKIAEYVQQQIEDGVWKPGDVIPSETLLAERFSASRPTVRTALTKLETQGLVKRTQGRGTVVQRNYKIDSTSIFLESFQREMKIRGEDVITHVLFSGIQPASDFIANKMGINPGEDVVCIFRVRYPRGKFDKGPMVYSKSYLPIYCRFLLEKSLENGSLYEALLEGGYKRVSMKKTISPCVLDDETADITCVPHGSMGLLIENICYLQNKDIIEVGQTYWPASKNEFTILIHQ